MLMNFPRMENNLVSDKERSLWRDLGFTRNRGSDVVLYRNGMGFLDSKGSAPKWRHWQCRRLALWNIDLILPSFKRAGILQAIDVFLYSLLDEKSLPPVILSISDESQLRQSDPIMRRRITILHLRRWVERFRRWLRQFSRAVLFQR